MAASPDDIGKRLLQQKLRNAKLKNLLLKKQEEDEDQGIFRETILPALNKGVAETMGFFGDMGELDRILTVKFRDMVGLDTDPSFTERTAGRFPSSRETKNSFAQLGIDVDPDESTGLRKVVGEGTRIATSTALFGAGSAGARAAKEGLGVGLRTLGSDVFIGGSAGVAGGVAQNSGVTNPVALAGIELGGGVTAATGLGVGRLAGRVVDPLTKGGRRRVVAETVQAEASNKQRAVKRLGESQVLKQTAFEQTDDIGMARIQKGLFDEVKAAEKIGAIAKVRTEQAASQIEAMFPNAGIRDFLTPIGRRYAKTLESLAGRTKKAIEKASAILSRPRGTSVVPEGQASEQARKLINTAQDEWNGIGKKLWDMVDDSVVTDTTAIKITLRDILRKQAKAEHSSNKIPQEMIDKINNLKPIDSVKEIQAIRSGLLKEIRSDAAGLNPEKSRVAKLVALQEAGLDTLQRGSGGDTFRIARQHSFIQNQMFSKGVLGDITSLKTTGADKIEPSSTLAVMFGGRNKIENVRQTKVAVGDDINAPMQDFLEAQFVKKAFPQGETGQFDVAAAARFMNSNESSIRMFPQLDSRLRRSVKVAADAKRRILKLDKTKDAVKKHSVAAKALNADPDQAVEAALSNNRFTPEQALKALLKTARRSGGKDAEDGVKHAIYRSWFSRSIDDLPDKSYKFNPQKMRSQIDKMGLKGNLSEDTLDRMTTLADELGRIEMFHRAPSQAASIEQQQSILSILARVSGARIGGAIGGKTSGGTIQSAAIFSRLLTKLSLSFGQKKLIALLEEALDDPKVLQDLLTRPTSRNQVKLFKRTANVIANLGNDLENFEQEQ